MQIRIWAVFYVAFALSAPSLRAEPSAAPEIAPEDSKDFCSYLKDVESKTDTACAPDTLATLNTQDPAAFTEKLASARKRKSQVEAAYEFLKTLPPENEAKPSARPPAGGPDPMHLTPPINDRTFPAWIGADAKDFRAVYGRWLQAQNAELEREQRGPASEERKKQIVDRLARNQERISSLEKIKDPAKLSCYLGDACGKRGDVTGPGVVRAGTGRTWTAEDYARANAQARVESHVPGGKLDRGMPSMGTVASEVVDNSPLGPLTGQPADKGQSPVRTAAELALAATGGLLLFGGLGGKQLEEKYPGIRRNMGIAALVGGSLATGAFAWRAMVPALPVVGQPQVQESEENLLERAEPIAQRVGQAVDNVALDSPGLAGPDKTSLEFAMNKEQARTIVSRLNLSIDQSKSALSAVRRATASSNFRISMDADNVVIRTVRAGRDGYQLMEYKIAPDGTKRVVQTAYDAADKLVHYDPK